MHSNSLRANGFAPEEGKMALVAYPHLALRWSQPKSRETGGNHRGSKSLFIRASLMLSPFVWI